VLLCDATYKLIWQGFPVLVLGTVDKTRQFQHIAISVTSNEQAADFQFLFQSIKLGVSEILNDQMNPKYVIADAAQAISNGFLACFENARVIMCWAHAKKNIDAKTKKLCPKEKLKEISDDISKLNLAKSDEAFDKASTLFLLKWANCMV
jgi:MULE transposase domain